MPSETSKVKSANPRLAWELSESGEAKIIDVRTVEELAYGGRVSNSYNVEWELDLAKHPNFRFLEELSKVCAKKDKILFLCNEERRSKKAASCAVEAGYMDSLYISEGFDGQKDGKGQRGNIDGWRKANLPWSQD